jgi:hypothetical protein
MYYIFIPVAFGGYSPYERALRASEGVRPQNSGPYRHCRLRPPAMFQGPSPFSSLALSLSVSLSLLRISLLFAACCKKRDQRKRASAV